MMKYKNLIAKHNPSQSHWELNEVLLDLERISINNVLEIGTHTGGSTRLWREFFEPKLLVGINNTSELTDKEGITFIEGDSQDERIIQQVREVLGGELFDFAFIDGGHLYKEVSLDFKNYSQMVRPGGIIVFHDVILKGNETCEVYKFWEELRVTNKTKTIWDGTLAGTGEGILYV